MRQLTDVINQILEISTNEELNSELKQIKSDASFTSPELMHMRWDSTHDLLLDHTPNPINNEMVKIFSVFSTKSENEIRESFTEV
ncbi:cell division protein [Bacillus pumilus]|uniref:cell division protein n=1 Tax=Bacillus pumilus TaxID=1408 RepID=UPI0011AB0017|nr:cell division protein [Bacillus pumilus]